MIRRVSLGRPTGLRFAPRAAIAAMAFLGGGPLAAGGPANNIPLTALPQEAEEEAEDQRPELAIEAIREGDYARARRLLDAVWIDDRTAAAKKALAETNPFVAISAVDEALRVPRIVRSERAPLLMLRGRAAFQAATLDSQWASLFEEAQENFEQAAKEGAGVSAAFRASRAARMIGAPEDALELARSGVRYIDGGEGRDQGLDVDQHYARTWAEAAFGQYVPLASAGSSDEEALATRKALFDETKSALERVIGALPTDTWAYGQLSNLYLWEGRGDEALQTAEAALAAAPNDNAAHIALTRLIGDRAQAAATADGADGAAAIEARYAAIAKRYAQFRASYPENALGYWYSAYEDFYKAYGQLSAPSDGRETFAKAQALFEGCRKRAAEYGRPCVDYEILCQLGIAWCQVNANEIDAAVDTFLGVDSIRTAEAANGATPALEMSLSTQDANGATIPQIPSARGGIDFITRKLTADPSNRAALTKAAAIADRVCALRPDDGNLANNAGFLNRDASMLWEAVAQRRFAQASTDDQRKIAEEHRAKAQALIEASWRAYQRAAELLPNDVRVVNDTGLVMAYYIRTDPEAAVGYFMRSIADGKEQLEDESMDPRTRATLTEAWGDAHENMGIIEWTIRRNPKAAREWFAQALEIGPPSRAWIGRQLIPLLDAWIETGKEPKDLGTVEARRVWTHNPKR